MDSRSLRSRVAGTNAETEYLAARESASEVHSEGLGSVEGVGSGELQR
jgi:hypothetical protein